MNGFAKILTMLVFIGFGLSLYSGAKAGWGVSGLRDQQTMSEIKKNCPEYYQNKDGECLRSTFRSYFLLRGTRGGGFGSGK